MEDVLDLYHQPYDPICPLVCFDETSKQLLADSRPPLPERPGRLARFDYEYVRHGVCNLFLFFAPLRAWRHVKVTEQRTAIDWAYCMRQLVDEFFPDAQKIRVVMDNLNTHNPAKLYEVFPAAEARRLIMKLEFHYTPVHASWLNMAEIEFSVLTKQCLRRRIPDAQTLAKGVSTWCDQRNQQKTTVDWRFTSEDARIKLRKLYPSY
jgi:hypothetical protein